MGGGPRTRGGETIPAEAQRQPGCAGKSVQMVRPLTCPRIPGTTCPCRHLGLSLSQPCHLLSWAPQIQPTWGSPRTWPLSPSPFAWTPSPTSCTAPCWAPIPCSSLCPPAPATHRLAAPSQALPGGRSGDVGAGTPREGQVGAGASSDADLGGLGSQRGSGQGTLRLAPVPHPRCPRHHHHHHLPRIRRRKPKVRRYHWPCHLPLRTGTLNTRAPRAQHRGLWQSHSESSRGFSWSLG